MNSENSFGGFAALGSLLLDGPNCDTGSPAPHPIPTPTPTPTPDPVKPGQDQSQHENQNQNQAETQAQSQAQSSYNESDNSNHNADCNANGNANGNGNLNLNGNGNLNLNGNENCNDNANQNVNENVNQTQTTVDTCVSVHVDVEASMSPPSVDHVLYMDGLSVGNEGGSFLVMPDFSTQTLNGGGNIFDLHEVNSLVSSGNANGDSVGLWTGGGGEGGCIDGCGSFGDAHGGSSPFTFSQSGSEYGNSASSSVSNAEAATGASSASVAGLSQEAFTQHISLGANIQYNSMPISVVGGDSLSDVHGSLDHSIGH